MDVQAMSKAPSPQTSTAGSAVKSTGPAGTAGTSANDNSFAAILGGMPQAEEGGASSGGAADDWIASILGSLQLLQTLSLPQLPNQPVQINDTGSLENIVSPIAGLPLPNQPIQSGAAAGQEKNEPTFPSLPMQALKMNSLLADLPQLDPKQQAVNKLQNVNPALLPLLDELKKAIELKSASTPRHSAEAAAIPGQNVIVLDGQESKLQHTKFRLDMMAAKNTGVAIALQEQLLGGNSSDNSDPQSSAGDSAQLPTSPLPLQDLLKLLGQAEQLPTALPQGTVNAQSFVREMSQFMTNNMKFSLGDALKEARLSLHPEQLGHVDVKITLHEGGQLVAQFAADTTAGRQLLESQLPQLRQALQSQGLQVDRLEVAQEQAGAASMFQQSRQQSNGGQPFERQPRQRITQLEADDGEFANGFHTIAEQRKDVEEPAEASFDTTA